MDNEMLEIFPADTFVVINKTRMNPKNNEILYMLYQPIIGSSCVSLYNTLCNCLNLEQILSIEHTHHFLMLNMRLSLNEIVAARKILEAVGLIKTYVKKSNINNYVYEIYSPLDPIDFLKHPLLNSALITNLEEKDYKRVVNYFKIPNFTLESYCNISSKFNDVFKSTNEIYNCNIENAKKTNYGNILLNDNLDINNILQIIPDDMINKKSINTDTIELIKKMAFVYNFNDNQLEEIIRSSINEKKMIDKIALKNNSCNFYKFENKGKLPNIIYKNQPESLRKENKTDSLKDKVIHTYEVTSPYVFLQNKYRGGKPNQSDLEMLAYLAEDVKLNTGVINVLIDYVLRVNDNKLIKKFVESVASQWKMSNVNTVEEAMEISKKEIKIKKSIVSKKNIKKEDVKPTWFNKQIVEEVDETAIREMENMLSQFK